MTDKPEESPQVETPHEDQIPLLIGGIDKDLLKETGRASAVQDLSGRVEKFGDIASAIQRVTEDALVKENKRVRRVNRVLLIGLFVVLLLSIATTYNSFTNKSSLDRSNDTLNKIDQNQAGIDELVAYLHTLPPPSTGQSKAVIDLETLVCKTTDSVELLAECNRLGINLPPQG